MGHSRKLRLGATLALVVTGAVTLATAAHGGLIFRETFHEEETVVETNFCGVAGLTVEFTTVVEGTAQAVSRGRDQLPYFMFQISQTEVVTNVANDKFVTATSRFVDKDLRVTDNGDGTLTILVLTTGNAVLYNAAGKAIARNPGQIRFEILVDHGGTPSNPSDDEFLEFLGDVKGSTGRTDDFCEAAVPALT